MKPITRPILSSLLLFSLAVASSAAADWTAGMQEGKATPKSLGPLAFGPDGILLAADTRGAALFAIATGDTQPAPDTKPLKVEGINQKIAALLGIGADQILIQDLVVNPISHQPYLAVSRGRGPDAIPTLVRVKSGGQLEVVSLDKVKFSRAELPDAPADRAGQANPRLESITDIAFFQDRVLVAGLSNEDFASTLRSVPFPFETVGKGTGVEIFHGSHGRFETRAPVRTFVAMKVGNVPNLLAAYTCTPLVQLPLTDLKPGTKVKGKTIAELGNHNRPIDMILYQKDGKDFLLLANSSRGIMKLSTDLIEKSENIIVPVKEEKKGLPYETIAGWTGIEQLDNLDPKHALVLRRADGGALNLESMDLP